MRIKIITIFPDCFPGTLGIGKIGQALKKNMFSLKIIDLKKYSKFGMVDDRPYGGSAGMILSPKIISKTLNKRENNIFMSPRGAVMNQNLFQQYSKYKNITILCGRYEGVDQRILNYYNITEISLGDFILCGGEVASQVFIEGIVRLLPNVVGNDESLVNESFNYGLLEHDHFTRPQVWNNINVPSILLNGHHKQINIWRFHNACSNTINNRPDVWKIFIFKSLAIVLLYKCFLKLHKSK